MKKATSVLTLFLILFAMYWSFHSAIPSYSSDLTENENNFSTDRALVHVKNIAQKPHAVGFKAHQEVRNYIVKELQNLGLETSLQEGYTAGDWGNLSKAINILARIKGSEQGKALLLLSHYDSNPHSSFGASDAGSGVATILEGVRTFLSQNKLPKNDIIILLSDAEELGLNGADLFVNEHPWIKDVGLVLNFEARGSGGPSYMLIETNRGNTKLIEEFTKANPKYPVANSLAYSIYKMLPNDTDLTVFREDGDIEGFNFAFIDDHYDYHTALDTYERLDKKTLAHQGSYLMPLLAHFSTSDLSNLKSLNDSVYFNIPFFNLISYPFEWIWIMYGLAILCFVVLLAHGFQKKVVHLKEIGKGFLPLLIALAINGVIGFYSWPVLKWGYPQYKDILQGFTYNGHTYILGFAILSFAICFWIYHKFRKIATANLLVAPIFLWLLLCALVSAYLPGASFFIIPVFGILIALLVTINQKHPNPFLLLFLALPAIFIFTPFLKMFPVGLGLKMLIATTLLATLTFVLLLPILSSYSRKNKWAYLGFILFIGCMISAHLNAKFTKENPKPTSLVYLYNSDTKKAFWASYENELSSWTKQFFNSNTIVAKENFSNTLTSKYATNFTFIAATAPKNIADISIEKTKDTIIGSSRILNICISPKRKVNRLEIFTKNTLEKASINSIKLSPYYLKNRKRNKLATHFISNNDYTELEIQIPKDDILELSLYEASNDLLTHDAFDIKARPEHHIPMPFVLNDAIIVTKTIRFD